MFYTLTEAQARTLAKFDRNYSAIKLRGKWQVWDAYSDHAVEFDAPTLAKHGVEVRGPEQLHAALNRHFWKNT